MPALAVLLMALAAATLTGCDTEKDKTGPPRDGKLITLEHVGELRAAFNRDHGTPRLILVFSPT